MRNAGDGEAMLLYAVVTATGGSPFAASAQDASGTFSVETFACPEGMTLATLVSIKEDAELDVPELKQLLQRVQKTIRQERNDVRYAMNSFVIAVGTYVQPLADLAVRAAERIGRVSVDMGDTACEVPYAPDYIRKARKGGVVAPKRKTAKC